MHRKLLGSLILAVTSLFAFDELVACSPEQKASLIMNNISQEVINDICGNSVKNIEDKNTPQEGKKLNADGTPIISTKENPSEKTAQVEKEDLNLPAPSSSSSVGNDSANTKKVKSHSEESIPRLKLYFGLRTVDTLSIEARNDSNSQVTSVQETIESSPNIYGVRFFLNKQISVTVEGINGSINSIEQRVEVDSDSSPSTTTTKKSIDGTTSGYNASIQYNWFVNSFSFFLGIGIAQRTYDFSYSEDTSFNSSNEDWNYELVGTSFNAGLDYTLNNLPIFLALQIQGGLSGDTVESGNRNDTYEDNDFVLEGNWANYSILTLGYRSPFTL